MSFGQLLLVGRTMRKFKDPAPRYKLIGVGRPPSFGVPAAAARKLDPVVAPRPASAGAVLTPAVAPVPVAASVQPARQAARSATKKTAASAAAQVKARPPRRKSLRAFMAALKQPFRRMGAWSFWKNPFTSAGSLRKSTASAQPELALDLVRVVRNDLAGADTPAAVVQRKAAAKPAALFPGKPVSPAWGRLAETVFGTRTSKSG